MPAADPARRRPCPAGSSTGGQWLLAPNPRHLPGSGPSRARKGAAGGHSRPAKLSTPRRHTTSFAMKMPSAGRFVSKILRPAAVPAGRFLHAEFLARRAAFPHPLRPVIPMNKVLLIGAGGVGSVVAHK